MKHLLVLIFSSLIAVSSLAWGAKGGGGKPPKDDVTDLVFTDDFTGSKIRLPDQPCTGDLAGQPCVLRVELGRLVQDGIDFDVTVRTSIRFDLYTDGVHINCGTDSRGFIPLESTGVFLSDGGAIMGTTAPIQGDKVSRDLQLKDPSNAAVGVSCQYYNRPPEIYGEIVYSGVGQFACLSGTRIVAGDTGDGVDPNTDLLSSVEAVRVTTKVGGLAGLEVPATCP